MGRFPIEDALARCMILTSTNKFGHPCPVSRVCLSSLFTSPPAQKTWDAIHTISFTKWKLCVKEDLEKQGVEFEEPWQLRIKLPGYNKESPVPPNDRGLQAAVLQWFNCYHARHFWHFDYTDFTINIEIRKRVQQVCMVGYFSQLSCTFLYRNI